MMLFADHYTQTDFTASDCFSDFLAQWFFYAFNNSSIWKALCLRVVHLFVH